MSPRSHVPPHFCITFGHFWPRNSGVHLATLYGRWTPAFTPEASPSATAGRLRLRAGGFAERVGIAKVVIREAQHLAAVEVIDNALVLTLLRYADELVETSQLSFPAGEKPRKAELDMARMLIESLASEWDPSKYTDEYRENLMKLIKARMRGEKPRLPAPDAQPQGEVVDLMERLRQSLESHRPSPRAARSARPAKAARRGSSKNKKTSHAA